MSEKIITIDNWVPQETCKRLCEMFDESQESKGERTYLRGDDIHCIRLDMKSMAGQNVNNDWLDYTKDIGLLMKKAFKEYHKRTNAFPNTKFAPFPPHIHRYDPEFGFHNASLFKENRLLSVIFYLNDVLQGDTIFEVDGMKTTIKPKLGRAVLFPATKEYAFKDTPTKDYMKYVIKGHIIKV